MDSPSLSQYEDYLVTLWREVGTVTQNGMGITPLAWTEIISWAEKFHKDSWIEYIEIDDGMWQPHVVTGSYLLDYELDILMMMSRDYVWESHTATEKNAECPIVIDLDEVDGEAESKAMGDALIAMFGNQDETAQ